MNEAHYIPFLRKPGHHLLFEVEAMLLMIPHTRGQNRFVTDSRCV